MKRFNIKDINTPKYWDKHQTATDLGLRQKKYLELAGKGKRIVEFGCGLSPFVARANKSFKGCFGIDFSPQTIYQQRKLDNKSTYIIANVYDTPFKDKFFDVSVSGEVLEHLKKPEDMIKEMVRITKNKIIISTPILEFEDPEHLWEFDAKSLEKMLKPYGYVIIKSIKSKRFLGREYLFAICKLKKGL